MLCQPHHGYYQPCARMQGMVVNAIPYEGDDTAFRCKTCSGPGPTQPAPAAALQPQQPQAPG